MQSAEKFGLRLSKDSARTKNLMSGFGNRSVHLDFCRRVNGWLSTGLFNGYLREIPLKRSGTLLTVELVVQPEEPLVRSCVQGQ